MNKLLPILQKIVDEKWGKQNPEEVWVAFHFKDLVEINEKIDGLVVESEREAWEKGWETAENVINQKFLALGMEPFMEEEKNILHWFGEYLKMKAWEIERDLREEAERKKNG